MCEIDWGKVPFIDQEGRRGLTRQVNTGGGGGGGLATSSRTVWLKDKSTRESCKKGNATRSLLLRGVAGEENNNTVYFEEGEQGEEQTITRSEELMHEE